MNRVLVTLDESIVTACLSHTDCSFEGRRKAGPDCVRRWIYGVGAAVFETDEDRKSMSQRLVAVRKRVQARASVADGYSARFAERGWHATEDRPEFSEALLAELALGSVHKGHVRYCVTDRKLTHNEKETVFTYQFVHLLAALILRYRDSAGLDVIFESDGSPAEFYVGIADAALGKAGSTLNVTVSAQAKGDPLLAIADYLLFYALKTQSAILAACPLGVCAVKHEIPDATRMIENVRGELQGVPHLGLSSRWFRGYSVFGRGMSSAVRLSTPR